MKSLFALVIATLYGVMLRIIVGFYQNLWEIMGLSLLSLTPLAIGYLTVALSAPEKARSRSYAFFRPWLTSFVLLTITILMSLEGTICWVMIYPIFATVAGVGGLIARYVLILKEKKQAKKRSEILDDLDDWGKPGTLRFSLLLLLPLMLGALEGDRLFGYQEYVVEREVVIAAPPSKIWATLTRVPDIGPTENRSFFTKLFGLPRQLRTELDTLATGGRRTVFYEQGVYFEQTIMAYAHEKQMTVAYKANPGNIPPYVLDEHLVVGGRHFKAFEDTYRLTPLPDGRCRLQLSAHILIYTPFNWYAGLWARWGMSDVLDGLLEMIAERAVR
jgi:Polyketide cyclase / dehydrase and lipid transport